MTLRGADVVVLALDGFEEMEFWYPVLRCREAGGHVTVVGVGTGDVRVGRCGYPVVPDGPLNEYDGQPALVIAPGLSEPPSEPLPTDLVDRLRQWGASGAHFIASSTGSALLAAAGLLDDVTVSCTQGIDAAVRAAGGRVGEAACSVSGHVATARSVDDVAELFSEIRRTWDLVAAG